MPDGSVRHPARTGRSGAAAPQIRTVDELSLHIRDVISRAPELRNVAVRGELQNFKRHSSGHVYFTLVGAEARIAGVLFRSHASAVVSWPQDGDEVVVTGSVDVYPKGGAYQLYANRILPVGTGAQARAKEALRLALEREGLFDVRHKRPLPRYPRKVAVVTSPTGAAVQDILKVSLHRSPFVDIVIVPAVVQGVDAPPQVARALSAAGRLDGVDCVILARGGGARDDLSPFDDERIVRSVRSCPVPVVTGVGHQTDSSLADLAADAALPTPSAAAEHVFPDAAEIASLLDHRLEAFATTLLHRLDRALSRVERGEELVSGYANALLAGETERLERLEREVTMRHGVRLNAEMERLEALAGRLHALSPLAVLARGYAICRDAAGRAVTDADALAQGDAVDLRFERGGATAEIVEIYSGSA